MAHIETEIDKNFEALRESRGWDHETLAAHLETGDPSLAAHFRAKAADGAPEARAKAPKGRRGAGPQETASA